MPASSASFPCGQATWFRPVSAAQNMPRSLFPFCPLVSVPFPERRVSFPWVAGFVSSFLSMGREMETGALRRDGESFDGAVFGSVRACGFFKIVVALQAQPEFWTDAEEAGEAVGGVGGDGAALMHQSGNAAVRNAGGDGELVLRDTQGHDEFLPENLAGMDIAEGLFHGSGSMVIHDLHVAGVPVLPAEADTPLVIDANAVLAGAAALEGFQPVRGWNAQVSESAGVVEHTEFAAGGVLNTGREPAGGLPLPNPLCLGTVEVLNHCLRY